MPRKIFIVGKHETEGSSSKKGAGEVSCTTAFGCDVRGDELNRLVERRGIARGGGGAYGIKSGKSLQGLTTANSGNYQTEECPAVTQELEPRVLLGVELDVFTKQISCQGYREEKVERRPGKRMMVENDRTLPSILPKKKKKKPPTQSAQNQSTRKHKPKTHHQNPTSTPSKKNQQHTPTPNTTNTKKKNTQHPALKKEHKASASVRISLLGVGLHNGRTQRAGGSAAKGGIGELRSNGTKPRRGRRKGSRGKMYQHSGLRGR